MKGTSNPSVWLGRTLIAALLGRERYGLELADRVRDAWAHDCPDDPGLDEGLVYAGLRSLEHRGFVVGKWVKGTDRPRRRCYALTLKGQRAAETQRSFRAEVRPVGGRAISGARS